ncbi:MULTISPECIES: hypothetical protein [Streptomyces]|uniref:hypothetical protein n=1 Tax=Streptomyces TaxID=1883 RepID=UPI000F71E0A1|nr:hypothetical protein [Streptomyces sp. W1SF4]AZM93564.1 hypothetical protein D1J60_33960 [Streptomyces sp. W1SF4]
MTTPNRALRRLPAWALLTALLASGCTGQGATPPAESAAHTIDPAQAETLRLPVEDYMLTPLQSARRNWLHGKLIQACMKTYGLEYPVFPEPVLSPRDSLVFRRYGITDAAAAAEWGYHLPMAQAEPSAAGSGIKPSAEQTTALFGRSADGTPTASFRGRELPKGGCSEKASEQLETAPSGTRGPGTGPDQLISTTKADSFRRSIEDPRVKAVFARWSKCLSTHGYDAPSPMEAGAGIPSIQAEKPDATEIEAAQADIACKRTTNLVGIWFTVESDYQRTSIADHRAEFEALAKARDADVTHTTELLTAYAP